MFSSLNAYLLKGHQSRAMKQVVTKDTRTKIVASKAEIHIFEQPIPFRAGHVLHCRGENASSSRVSSRLQARRDIAFNCIGFSRH